MIGFGIGQGNSKKGRLPIKSLDLIWNRDNMWFECMSLEAIKFDTK
jgi:hypothetical protein